VVDLLKDKVAEALKMYREISSKALSGEIEPNPPQNDYSILDLLASERPTFQLVNPEDPVYVSSFRLLRWSEPVDLGQKTFNIVLFTAGRVLGENAVERGLIKNLDDLVEFALNQRLGIYDIVSADDSSVVINVYESISSSGIPNIGRTVCHFERGFLTAVFSKLYKRRVTVEETHCWGTGYSFDRFEIKISDVSV
jgi:predicted hydrocarbon binding protein